MPRMGILLGAFPARGGGLLPLGLCHSAMGVVMGELWVRRYPKLWEMTTLLPGMTAVIKPIVVFSLCLLLCDACLWMSSFQWYIILK